MIEPINLLKEYSEEFQKEIRDKFQKNKESFVYFSEYNVEFDLKKGDLILFRNGYGVEHITEILGFDGIGLVYLLWDCFWFPVNLKDRFIDKITPESQLSEWDKQNIKSYLESSLSCEHELKSFGLSNRSRCIKCNTLFSKSEARKEAP